MKNERRHVFASAITGIIELVLAYVLQFYVLKGLGIGMLLYSVTYILINKYDTGA